jgi:hypothetical protein
MTNVRHEIQKLAAEFAENVVVKLRQVLNNEFLGGGGILSKPHLNGVSPESPRVVRARKSGRLQRSSKDIQDLSAKIVELLKQNKEGMRAEEIREALSIERREWQKPISIALESGMVSKSGEKRATVYVAIGAAKNAIYSGDGKTKTKKAKAKKKAKVAGKTKKPKKSVKKAARFTRGDRDSMPPSPLDEGEDEGSEESELEDDSA